MASELDQLAARGPERAGRRGEAQDGSSDRLTVIRPASRLPRLDLRELWHYRELLGVFVWRDIKVRYKQTAIGAAWAMFQPVLTAAVYTIVFGKFAQFPSGSNSYPLFVFAGLLPMQFFASALTLSSVSVVANVNLVTKAYFPRVLLPLAAVLVPVVDFAIALVVLAGMMVWFDISPSGIEVLAAPLFLLLAIMTALGIGLWLSAVNVRYRDVPYVIPVFLQVLPFLSGVPYAVALIPSKWQWILSLNPITGVISGWRWSMLGAGAPNFGQLAVGVAVSLLLFGSGIVFFRSSEPRFADTI